MALFAALVVMTECAQSLFSFRKRYAHSIVAIVKLSKENLRLKKQVGELQAEVKKLRDVQTRKKIEKKKKPFMFKLFITDRNINYYTGVSCKALFKALHEYIVPFVCRRWYGSRRDGQPRCNFKTIPAPFGPQTLSGQR